MLAQSFTDVELVVLDNASEDDVATVVARFDDKRLRMISNSQNIGGPANVLKAFEISSSEFVMIFHDDDVMHPHLLETQVEILKKDEDVVFVAPSVNLISEDADMDKFSNSRNKPSVQHKFYSQGEFLDAHFSGRYLVGFGGVMYRTSIIKREKLNIQRFGNIADRPYLVSLSGLGKSVFLVYPNYNVRMHDGQDSGSRSWNYKHEIEAAKYYLSLSKKTDKNPYYFSILKMLAQLHVVRPDRPKLFTWMSELKSAGLLHWSLVSYLLPYYYLRSCVVKICDV